MTGPCLAAGLLVALSLPPWGWWPLAFVGFAIVAWRITDLPMRTRGVAGFALGLGIFVPGWWWMSDFNAIGAVLAMIVEALIIGLGVLATHGTGRWQWLSLAGGLVLAEELRSVFPFGGVPLGGVALGQVGGPLAPAARLGGALVLLGMAALIGGALAGTWRRRLPVVVAVVMVTILGAAAPDGGGGPARRVAVVQGGGRRGYRAIESDPFGVLEAHLAASALVRPPVDLVLWPEDVIDVGAVGPSALDNVADVARRLGTTVVVGIVEDADSRHFRNAAIAWSAAGEVIGRYDKVRRVPFGEYIPGRSLINHLVNLDAVSRDALPGHGTGLLRTPVGPVGVVISYEVFFAGRARSAIRAGGQLLLVPTNASSFRTSQVPTTEIAAARLRAIETGRDVVQAAPTGYSGFIDNHGRLRVRTVLGRRQVVQRLVHLRRGRTIYMRVGDAPAVVLALVAVLMPRLRRRGRP